MRWALLVLLFGALPALAETILGRVVGVTDGDTITVLDGNNRQHQIRLAGIDAPEKRQPFFKASNENIARLAFGKQVKVDWYKRSYKRLVGNVFVGGMDIGLAQVAAGFAWHYKRFENEQSTDARSQYAAAEDIARRERRGLWKDTNPVPPWEWRDRRR